MDEQELIDDFNMDPELKELGGHKAGDTVRVVEDNEDEGYYVDEAGLVLGCSRTPPGTFNPEERLELIVQLPGRTSPLSVDPDHVEAA